MKLFLVVCSLLLTVPLFADKVELRDGTLFEGTILTENPDSIEIEIGRNDRGTIRRVLIIHASEIKTWESDSPRTSSAEEGTEEETGMVAVAGVDHVGRMLREAEAKLRDRQVDEGIQLFGQAADTAVDGINRLEPEAKVEALNLRAHALRLQLAALEGKVTILEGQSKSVQDDLDSRKQRLSRDTDTLTRDRADFNGERGSGSVDLRTRKAHNELVAREEELDRRRAALEQEQAAVGTRVRELEIEQLRTQNQMEIVKERAEQAQNNARTSERNLRRRR
jgi:hypothetical protein